MACADASPGSGRCGQSAGKAVDDRHHRVAVGNGKRAAGAEIVLHVNNEQQIIVVGQDLHP